MGCYPSIFYELYDEYRAMYVVPDATPAITNSQEPKSAQGILTETLIDRKLWLDIRASSNTKSELDKYLVENIEDLGKVWHSSMVEGKFI